MSGVRHPACFQNLRQYRRTAGVGGRLIANGRCRDCCGVHAEGCCQPLGAVRRKVERSDPRPRHDEVVSRRLGRSPAGEFPRASPVPRSRATASRRESCCQVRDNVGYWVLTWRGPSGAGTYSCSSAERVRSERRVMPSSSATGSASRRRAAARSRSAASPLASSISAYSRWM